MKPFVTYSNDYHDFKDFVRVFNHAGITVQYKEIGCGFSDLYPNGVYGKYHAVFYEPKDHNEAMELAASFHML